jgi:hypothetical protein
MYKLITYFEVAAFASSVMAWPIIRNSKHLKLFPLLLFVVASVEVYTTFFTLSHASYYNAWIYNVQVPLQHLLYLLILNRAMEVSIHRFYTVIAMTSIVITATVTLLFFVEPNQFNVIEYCLGSIFIIIGILMKFYEMLQNPTAFNFLKVPFFYMLFAFLLFNVGTLPYFAMSNWLASIGGSNNIVILFRNVMSILNYVLYTTYTITFIWIILRKDFCS